MKGRRLRAWLAAAWPPIALVATVTAACVVTTSLGSNQIDRVVTTSAINVLFVVALYTFVGNSGILSFGHMAFAAIGAYTASLLTMEPSRKGVVLTHSYQFLIDAHLGTVPALAVAGAVTALVAAVLSIPLMRLSGIAAGLATFAVLIIVNVVASNWKAVTNAASGLNGVPRSTTSGSVLPWVCLAIVVAYLFQISPSGRRLRASREDEIAARSIGIGVFGQRRVAFVLSAYFTGVAGGLLASYLGSFTPANFYTNSSFVIIAMLVIGGMLSLTGAVVGAIAVSAAQEVLLRLQEGGISIGPIDVGGRPGIQQVALALLMLVTLARRPMGLTGGREWRAPFTATPVEIASGPRNEGSQR